MKFLSFLGRDEDPEPARPLQHPMVSFGIANDNRVVFYIRENDGAGPVWISLHMSAPDCKMFIEDLAYFAGFDVTITEKK